MARLFPLWWLAFSGVAILAGCSGFRFQDRPAWRTAAEGICLAEGRVRETAWIRPMPPINGPGICGLTHPFKVSALSDGTVRLVAPATLDCSMIPALEEWLSRVVQPAAMTRFGEQVVEIRTMGAYSCRGINNESGGSFSEHAFGNAVDIAGFALASGRVLNVLNGWNGPDVQEQAFLREAQGGACSGFTTVLGPGSNALHANHIHVDLALHGTSARGARRICKPVPAPMLPAPPGRDTPVAANSPETGAIGSLSDTANQNRPLALAEPSTVVPPGRPDVPAQGTFARDAFSMMKTPETKLSLQSGTAENAVPDLGSTSTVRRR